MLLSKAKPACSQCGAKKNVYLSPSMGWVCVMCAANGCGA